MFLVLEIVCYQSKFFSSWLIWSFGLNRAYSISSKFNNSTVMCLTINHIVSIFSSFPFLYQSLHLNLGTLSCTPFNTIVCVYVCLFHCFVFSFYIYYVTCLVMFAFVLYVFLSSNYFLSFSSFPLISLIFLLSIVYFLWGSLCHMVLQV